jgi:hypothetical protein
MAANPVLDKKRENPPTWRALLPYERVRLALALVALTLPFLAALLLTPDARGYGTHQQLGMPPCMMMQLLQVPCALCGMTTAFTWFAHGHPVQALVVQPAGALGAAALAAGIGALLGCTALGRTPVGWPRHLGPRRLMLLVGAVVAGAWLYKLLRLLL